MTPADAALLALLQALDQRGYDFVTPLNSTVRLVRGRPGKERARDLRDVLGWSLPFDPGQLDAEIESLLREAGALREGKDGLRSAVRVSRLQGLLFLHSAFGMTDADPVFLGPDSYRFAEFLRVELSGSFRPRAIYDVGSGCGVGGLVAGRLTCAAEVCLSDVNPKALQLARINARYAGVASRTHLGPGLSGWSAGAELVVANPPFIAGGRRTYNDGGAMYGAGVSLDWSREAMDRLPAEGRLLLYTGSAIVGGQDPFRRALETEAAARGCEVRYRELDPDIFGEELRREAYADVERIAAVGAVVTKG